MKGRIHIPIAGWVDVEWEHKSIDEITYTIECSKEFTIVVKGEKSELTAGAHTFTLKRVEGTDTFK
jgi:hypothetical protein